MTAPPEISELIDKFARNLDAYRSGKYNETQVRVEFIDPLFVALGWDLHNKQGYAEAYKDVIHEDQIRVSGASKAPDYCFRIGGTRKFFVEAKKPSVNIKHDISPAYQLRRYAWSAKLPLSIVTDFEEFAVYDCRVKPAQNDPASKARILYCTYTEYLDRWEEITGIFSRDAVLKGSFDKYAESNKRKKGTAEVDNAFLEEIESWREWLAHNIALRNKDLPQRDLNHAVQATIDRIIFLRIAEDRGLEPENQLRALISGDQTYPRLAKHFRDADDRYNSGLFHFRKEKDRDDPDNWTLSLAIDDKVLKQIFKRLYYPESPYEFSVLPADILGQVYERFLGKVIRLKGKSAVVEEKPEVRKAGGVYYTPTYIVDYIVEHTVGKLIEGKTPDQIRGKGKDKDPIRVLDPACGSGSFLLGAYQFLLDWYLDRYKEEPEKHLKGKNPAIFETAAKPAPGEAKPGKEFRLTTAERKRILLDHIYGVDIDTQAVEVTKLSLLLKVLEGENVETLNKNMALFHERALPDLDGNIKCGNSLIGSDFYQGQQLEAFDEEELYRINAFDWTMAFPKVFARENPGFDAVIGNPPWGSKTVLSRSEVSYLMNSFSRSSHNMNIFAIFIDLACYQLLQFQGRFGFLVPKNFLKTNAYLPYRYDLLTKMAIDQIADFGQFPQVAQECVGLFAVNDKPSKSICRVDHTSSKQPVALPGLSRDAILTDSFAVISLVGGPDPSFIIQKVRNVSISLGKEFDVLRGMEHGRNGSLLYCKECERYFERPGKQHRHKETTPCRSCNSPIPMNSPASNYTFIHKEPSQRAHTGLLIGNSIDRYRIKQVPYYVELGLTGIDYKSIHEMEEKLLFIRISQTLRGYLDTDRLTCLNALNVVARKPSSSYNCRYVLGLLNSRLMAVFANFMITAGAHLTIRFSNETMRSLPIRTIDFDDSSDKARHDQMVTLVQRMLDLHQRLQAAKSAHDRTALQRQIDATDAEIDRLVYELYGLTDDEIRIVEEATRIG